MIGKGQGFLPFSALLAKVNAVSGFKIWAIRDETTASKRLSSWPNGDIGRDFRVRGIFPYCYRNHIWNSWTLRRMMTRPGKWVEYGWGVYSVRVNYRLSLFGSGTGEVRVWIYLRSIMFGSGMNSVRLKLESGLFWMVIR